MSEKFCNRCKTINCHAREVPHWGRLMILVKDKIEVGPVVGYILPGSIADCPRITGNSSEAGQYFERLNIEAEEYLKSQNNKGEPGETTTLSGFGLESFIEELLRE